MDAQLPVDPRYQERATVATREYRIVFWRHQLPPEGSGISPDDMSWSELTCDLTNVADVHEAIEWAETQIDKELDKDSAGPHGERRYVLYARVPGQDWFIQLAGCDPTRDSG